MKAHARKQVGRAVLPEQIPPANLERPTRGELQLLRGNTGILLAPDHAQAHVETASVTDCCGRRFLDGNHDVPRCLVAMTQVVDLEAGEKSRGCRPLAALRPP